jgi:EpsG family
MLNDTINVRLAADIRAQLVLLAGLTAVFLVRPLMTLMMLCVFLVWGDDRKLRAMFLLAVCLLFCILNLTKQVDGDLLNYVNLQDYLSGRPLLTLLDVNQLRPMSPTYRPTEPGFYGPQWLLAQITDNTSASIVILGTLGVYIPTFAALIIMGRVKGWNHRLTMVVALCAFFAAINPTNITNLVRQDVSASFAFLALATLLEGRKLAAVAWALVSCSIHNGSAYLIACFLVLAVLFPYGRPFWGRPWGSTWRVLCALGVLGGSVALLWFQQAVGSGLLEKSDVTVWHYLASVVLFSLFWYCSRVIGSNRGDYYLSLAFVVTMFVSGSFFAMQIRVTALRYFVYVEWLWAPMVAVMLCAIPRRHLGAYLASRWLACCAALCLLILRISTSGWVYGPDSRQVLSSTAPEIFSYIGT